jgi:formylglycine-generating enzyme required for sulfatase activity
MQGNVMHRWQAVGTNPKLLPDGHLLDASKDDPSGFAGFQEVDWDGKVVWQYTESRAGYAPHHDFIRVNNKKLGAATTMYIANRSITNAQALAVGADPANAPYDKAQVDAIVEVDASGTVVWEWWFLDHLVQAANPAWPNYVGSGKTLADSPGRLDEQHPISGVRWLGAAAFCNWYGAQLGLTPCYTLPGGATDWTARCIRLPTEAEWECAGRGGLQSPYANYPWGDQTDDARVNWIGSNDPWEQGPVPQTTPVGFFDGSLRKKSDHAWPGAMESYQTLDGRNGYGLFDMAGNVWELVNDWYARDYYAKSPAKDPPGPEAGDPMPDGLPYRNLRGGSFFNFTVTRGDHERVSNRDPSYFRGKYLGVDDPNGPWFHIGFRVVMQRP